MCVGERVLYRTDTRRGSLRDAVELADIKSGAGSNFYPFAAKFLFICCVLFAAVKWHLLTNHLNRHILLTRPKLLKL